jgi:hypothetical protein
MRITTSLPLFIAAIVLAITIAHADPPPYPYHYFTNATAIANGQIVISALHAGDSGRVQALVGSGVGFQGDAPWSGGGTNIIIESNIVLNVELQPSANVRTTSASNQAWVSGILKSIDFQKRVIYIRAKPKDYWKGAAI